ncbi:hypothetical protein F8M41_006193 [Gigaspora margarita]|uniref:Uncharacterized protein n=1 Tax=Gigaspora margarita TaxID=4874 RepID=A0A8H3X8V1_GIGMA|nr:hypothetical protein F8M41_006193 [Gigaspora margarita]
MISISVLDKQEIKLKFVEEKALIDKFEEEDEEQHGFYKYRYHQPTPEKVNGNQSIQFINAESNNQYSDSGKSSLEKLIEAPRYIRRGGC